MTMLIPFLVLFWKLHSDGNGSDSADDITRIMNTLIGLKKNLTSLHYHADFIRANKTDGNITDMEMKILNVKRDIVAISFKLNHEKRANAAQRYHTSSSNRHSSTSRKAKKTKKTIDPLKMALMEKARMMIDDKHLNNLSYYKIHDPTNVTLLTTRSIENVASLYVATKGFYVFISRKDSNDSIIKEERVVGLDKEPFHSYYQYTHNYSDPCLIHYISLKYDPDCGDSLASRLIRPLLIVSVQRSGSHYAWEMLNRLGIHVHHEGLGPDGAVSWLYAINANTIRIRSPPRSGRPLRKKKYGSTSSKETKVDVVVPATSRWNKSTTYGTVGLFIRSGYVINNPEKISQHRFQTILHQVRHPLRVISTLVKRCPSWDKFWRWIANAKGMKAITKTQSPLKRAMLLYILWNKHIERYADIRFKSETTSPKTICLLGNFKDRCNGTANSSQIIEPVVEPDAMAEEMSEEVTEEGEEEEGEEEEGKEDELDQIEENPDQIEVVSKPMQTTLSDITWADVEKEDTQLANELKIMCLEYGYDLDPSKIPQNEETKQFTA